MNVEAQEEQGGKEQESQEGHQLLHVTLAQGGALSDDRTYYFDGCSTFTAFKSDKHLKNIKTVLKGGVKINCNVGTVATNLQGAYGGIKVRYLPDGIANIFSMHELKRSYHITSDSWEGYYVVHTLKGEVRFYKDEQGLPYIDLGESNLEARMMLLQREIQECKETLDNKVSYIQTVHGNYEGYTKQEVTQAKEARRAQAMMGNPSEKDYKGMVSNNLIANCPITSKDLSNTRTIFRPDLASIRGKTVQRAPEPVVTDYVAVPRTLIEASKVITLAVDAFFVDGTAFLLTVTRRILFVTAEHVPVRTATSLSKHLKRVLEVYGRAGFVVRTILMDGEFERIKSLMPSVECNTTAAKEHVSEAERTI